MGILFILFGASFLVAITFLIFFLLSIKNGQFDDMHTPSVRILFDNKHTLETNIENGKSGERTTTL
jgi:cbb3-type cytochrome oxidase maturation protein